MVNNGKEFLKRNDQFLKIQNNKAHTLKSDEDLDVNMPEIRRSKHQREEDNVSLNLDSKKNPNEIDEESPNIELSSPETNNINHEINEEALLRATKPKKISVLSSGGLSNKFVSNIEKRYSGMFEDKSFKIFFETFGFQKTTSDITKKDKRTSEPSGKFIYKEPLRQTQLTSYNRVESIGTKNGIKFPSQDHDDQISNIHSKPEHSESLGTSEDSLEKSEMDRQPTLKDRALKIFHELKKKLGLIGKSETNGTIESEESVPDKSKMHTESVGEKDSELMVKDRQVDVSYESELEQPYLIEQHDKVELMINKNDLNVVLKDNDIVFVITYLDDDVDMYNTFEILEVASELHIFPVVITSLPRYFGKVDNVHLMNKSLQKLRLKAEMVLLLPYFKSIDPRLIPDLILELIELIKEPGLINVDVADLKIIIKGGNVGVISFGTGKGQSRVKDAFFQTIDSKLLNVELAGVKKALLNVTGGSDMTIGEVEALADQIKNRIKPGARLILGARINQEWNEKIKIFLMLGVTPMQVMVNRYAYE
jgi:hypothetical protein